MPGSISDIRLLLKVKSLPKAANARCVFITGGTGYLGGSLIPVLIERGHRVRALMRPESKGNLPPGCEVVSGNALDANTYKHLIRPADTFVHLVGVPTSIAIEGSRISRRRSGFCTRRDQRCRRSSASSTLSI